eukprot:88274-Rhodomonas_salina.1
MAGSGWQVRAAGAAGGLCDPAELHLPRRHQLRRHPGRPRLTRPAPLPTARHASHVTSRAACPRDSGRRSRAQLQGGERAHG